MSVEAVDSEDNIKQVEERFSILLIFCSTRLTKTFLLTVITSLYRSEWNNVNTAIARQLSPIQ